MSSTTFSVGAGIYLVVVAMLASTVGGYLAGRLRNRWAGIHQDEVYFRDTAHGFLAWAFAAVLGATVMGAATTHILASASAGLIPATGAAAATAASNPTDTYVDTLLRADTRPAAAGTPGGFVGHGPGGSARGTRPADRQQHAQRQRSVRRGPDLRRPGCVGTHRVDQAEAEKRVNDVIVQAKKAADDARKAAAKLSLWLAASMLAGALAASSAATEGGLLRDLPWYEAGWLRARSERNDSRCARVHLSI